MNHEIVCDGKVIAQFADEEDAKTCLEIFEELYDDCEFLVREIK